MKADELANKVLHLMQGLDADQMQDFASIMTATMISVMRGINDDEFVKDFLTSAINDKKPPIITPRLRQ